jgi:hypothetical protein
MLMDREGGSDQQGKEVSRQNTFSLQNHPHCANYVYAIILLYKNHVTSHPFALLVVLKDPGAFLYHHRRINEKSAP